MAPLLSSVLVSLLLSAALAAAPNVIFIVADDLGWGDLSLTGLSNVHTPHIDALLETGLRLTRYYGQPVCSPSRAAIHTGRLPLALGLQTCVFFRRAAKKEARVHANAAAYMQRRILTQPSARPPHHLPLSLFSQLCYRPHWRRLWN